MALTPPLICPTCRTPLPAIPEPPPAALTCATCAAEVDLSRAGTGAGRPRFVAELDRTGLRVGRYLLGERLGAGGMGTVYAARADGDDTPVAVKFLAPALAGDPEVAARFAREVKLLGSLSHPGIVRVLDHGTADGVPWFAMERIVGEDLRGWMAAGRLTPAVLAETFPTLLAALAHAHGRGVVHRDIKPANILLDGAGRAKLADFGIAHLGGAGNDAATRLTVTAAVVGTLPYMSPEQRVGVEVDARSDLFSVGVVLYEAATRRLPIGAFAPPSRHNAAYSPAFDRVVARLLQPEPADRFATADEAASALGAALRPRRRLARAVAFGAGVAIAAALGLGGPALLRAPKSEKTETTEAAKAAPAPPAVASPTPVPPPPPGTPPEPAPSAVPSPEELLPELSLGEITKGGKKSRPTKTTTSSKSSSKAEPKSELQGKRKGKGKGKTKVARELDFKNDFSRDLGKERPLPERK